MFTLTGILADEEPKTPISPNGLYNSSDLTGSGDFTLSSTLIGGTSEATLMGWFYLSPSTPSNFGLYPYQEVLAGEIPLPIYFLEDKIKSSFPNSSGGNNVCEYLTTTPINQWIHIAVTWSVSNSRMRIYLNGVQQASSTITYANASTTSAFFKKYSGSGDSVNIAQFNVYDRELTGTEVAEHYVEIDSQVGVLAYDAMTTAQRSGLIYSTSFIDDISFNGNELKDRSTSNISISPQPSLTGQQIYVYTDVSTSQIYAVNSAVFDGATSSRALNIASTPSVLSVGNINTNHAVWAFRFKTSSAGTEFMFHNGDATDNFNNVGIYHINGQIRAEIDKTNADTIRKVTNSAFNDGNWHTCAVYWNSTTSLDIYIDGALQAVTDAGTTGTTDSTSTVGENFTWGKRSTGSALPFVGELAFGRMFRGTFTSQDFVDYHNTGTAICFDDLPTSWSSTVVGSWKMANYNSNTGQELVDETVNGNNLTNVNSTPFTGTGLNVECST